MIQQAIIIADLHSGCRQALYPMNAPKLDLGGEWITSPLQKKIWLIWEDFHNVWVPKVTKEEDYIVVLNGDGVDGRHHGSTTQVSQNHADQIKICQALLEPVLAKKHCTGLIWIRGTEAHTGPSAEIEEILAKSLGAIPDTNGNYSRMSAWVRLGGPKGALMHLAHHIGVTGRTHYEPSAVGVEVGEQFVESGRWQVPAADITIRSHRHRYCEVRMPSARGYSIGTVTPGWQGATPFTRKVAGGRIAEPQFGGVFARCGDEEHYTRAYVHSVTRDPEVII